MGRMAGGRNVWVRITNRFRQIQARRFCNRASLTTANNNKNGGSKNGESSLSKYDAYRDLDKLDFMTAAKILFTESPKEKKFGLDFHLVQLFFVCMPPLAVYLVAQYARYEMRRMDAELQLKKQADEEAKAKEVELQVTEEKAAALHPELVEMKVRLYKLEEAIKEITVESKGQPGVGSAMSKSQEDGEKSHQPSTTQPSDTQKRSEASSGSPTATRHTVGSGSPSSGQSKPSGLAQLIDISRQDHKGTQSGGRDKDA